MANQIIPLKMQSCERFGEPGVAVQDQQAEIAARAFELWLTRSFRNGSPQEDWLQAQWEVLGLGPEAA